MLQMARGNKYKNLILFIIIILFIHLYVYYITTVISGISSNNPKYKTN